MSTLRTMSGFTLLELIVAIVLTSLLVIYLTQLYQMTGQTVSALKSAESDWGAEQFMRQQIWQSLPAFNTDLKQFQGEKYRLQFSTRYSGKAGDTGAYVKAIYYYDSHKQTLEYEERPYSNWWTDEGREAIRRNADKKTYEPLIVFKQIKDLQFSYSYKDIDGTIKWKDKWDKPDLPTLIKLNYLRGGQLQTFIFDHQVLSFSIASGF